jgi:hypothetical protein
MAQRIQDKVKNGVVKKDLFDEAEREVFKLIDLNDMPRMRKSESNHFPLCMRIVWRLSLRLSYCIVCFDNRLADRQTDLKAR